MGIEVFTRIEKRIRFVIAGLVLSLFLVISTFFFFDQLIFFLPVLVILTYLSTVFALAEGIEKIEWLMLFLIPCLASIAFYLFYFLFPVRWLTRIPFAIAYGVSMYAILLSMNIFNVGVERNLQLYRAGFATNYFFHTLIFFLLATVFLSFRWGFFANGVTFGLLGYVMSLQYYWSIKLDLALTEQVKKFALLTGFVLGEAALLLSFLPLPVSVFGLVMACVYYVVSGLIYLHIDDRLFPQSLREYMTIAVIIGIIILFSLVIQ